MDHPGIDTLSLSMDALLPYAPWLAAMALLMGASAFFSASEAALFYLTPQDRRRMAEGDRLRRAAVRLLADADRLLTAVLFWNLLVNVLYFTVASIVGLHLERSGHAAQAGAFALTALLAMILVSEMVPKSLGVLQPERLSALVSMPLTLSVRAVGPLVPALRTATLLSQRVLWPQFQSERYLYVRDLERAVELSTTNAALVEQEQVVLQSIVSLSETRADELMRPRNRYLSFRPPVALSDLEGRMPPSGYLLVTDEGGDEVTAAIALREMRSVPQEHLERHALDVVYVPWCVSVAQALERMRRYDRRVAAVLNEYGETIGVLTFDDILDTMFGQAPSRSQRLLRRPPIRQVRHGVWEVTGITSLRRLARYFRVERPPAKSNTVAGAIQELLERFPQADDEVRWGPFRLRVIDVTEYEQVLVELTLAGPEEDAS